MPRLVLVSLLLVPAVLLADVAQVGDTTLFVLSTASLIPLAYVIGEATEAAGAHTGPAVAGLLNASFGNAPELIISLFAVDRGLQEFVRGSLTGSVVSNLLLVLGATVLAGGRGRLDRVSSSLSLAQTTFALLLFLLPAAEHHWNAEPTGMRDFTVPVSVVLLVVYLVATAYGVRRAIRDNRRRLAEAVEAEVAEEAGWSLQRSIVVLVAAALATAFVSHVLTGSVESFASAAHLDEFFVAAVIVALVGNAAEHGGAIVIARRGGMGLAAEIAFSSSAQVALFVIPLVVLLSLMIKPLPLAFRPVELATMAVAVVVPGAILLAKDVRRWAGVVLVASYGTVAAAYWLAG